MSSSEELKHLQIPLRDLSLATNGFALENFIAKGGFGRVYRGTSEKHGIIAVKRLDPRLQQGDHEFKTELDFLSVYKHENIVSLLGFCDEEGEKILVYKYESNGSLDKLLKSKDLTWIQRLQICLDAARGLKYLHDDVGPKHRILHRDIKSANILLDENFKAKVSDFGLSREGPANVQTTFVISKVCGTPGYVDPDYFYGGHLTQRSDVFSFGVVLFEVLCGRLAYVKINDQFFNMWVQKHYKEQTIEKIIHHDLQEQINPASLLTFSAVAYQCLKNGVERPTMKTVVEQLQKALDNQLATSVSRFAYDDFSDLDDHDFNVLRIQSRGKVKKKGPQKIHQQHTTFKTKSDTDYLKDGYHWRKYGQKAVKDSPFPRSYYRCTNDKCSVKKRVERSPEDPTILITTYEGQHCHHTVRSQES